MRRRALDDLSGWLEHDRPYLVFLDKRERLQYFKLHVEIALLDPLAEMLDRIQPSESPNHRLLCFSTCLCSGVEALGSFWTGDYGVQSSEGNFRAFVTDHMDSRYRRRFGRNSYLDILWRDFRNGLAHGFTTRAGCFDWQRNYFRVADVQGSSYLSIHPRLLHEDFDHAARAMIHALRSEAPSGSRYGRFNRTFEAVFIQGQ